MDKIQGSSLSLRRLDKYYDRFHVIRDVSLDVPPGSLLTLLGPSGCGKTTVLRMIAGFVASTSGEILVDGRDIAGLQPEARDTGMVFQNYALFPHMTAADNVAFGLRMRRLRKAEIAERVRDALDMVKLGALAGRYPSQLSGGQQQRVALARALVIRPKLLLLDEPLGALDRNLRDEMQAELRNLQRSLGITTVVVTHDQDEALYLSDWIAVLKEGRIEQFGQPLDIYDRPASQFVSRFMGIANLFPARVVGSVGSRVEIAMGDVRVAGWHPEGLAAGRDVQIAVRPTHVEVAAAIDPREGFVGTVSAVAELGEKVVYQVDAAGTRVEAHASRMRSVRRHEPGATVKVVLDPDHTIVLER